MGPIYEGMNQPPEKSSVAAAMGRLGGGGGGGLMRASRPTNTEVLREKKAALEAELKRVDEALAALQDHPEIEMVMNLVQQALY